MGDMVETRPDGVKVVRGFVVWGETQEKLNERAAFEVADIIKMVAGVADTPRAIGEVQEGVLFEGKWYTPSFGARNLKFKRRAAMELRESAAKYNSAEYCIPRAEKLEAEVAEIERVLQQIAPHLLSV